jgi:signal transduction histidine kinase
MTTIVVVLTLVVLHFDRHATVHQKLFGAQADVLSRLHIDEEGSIAHLDFDALGYLFKGSGPVAVYVRVLDSQGKVLQASPNIVRSFEPIIPDSGEMQEAEIDFEGATYRLMYSPVVVNGSPIGWIETWAMSWTGASTISVQWIAVLLGVVLILSLVGGYVITRRALNPIAELVNASEQISADNLSARLPITSTANDEVSRLTRAINSMLERLENGFEREKNLTADAAHEMMNPISIIATEAQVSLRKPRSDNESRQSMEVIVATCNRLSSMLTSMLTVSSNPQMQRSNDNSDITQMVDTWKRQALAQDKLFSVNMDNFKPVDLSADGQTIVHVLVDNALKYTRRGDTVTLSFESVGDQIHIRVQDTGIGISEDDGPRIFDRFFRSSRSDVMNLPGHGLGLSIAKTAAERLGGTIEWAEGADEETSFKVTIPKNTS